MMMRTHSPIFSPTQWQHSQSNAQAGAPEAFRCTPDYKTFWWLNTYWRCIYVITFAHYRISDQLRSSLFADHINVLFHFLSQSDNFHHCAVLNSVYWPHQCSVSVGQVEQVWAEQCHWRGWHCWSLGGSEIKSNWKLDMEESESGN